MIFKRFVEEGQSYRNKLWHPHRKIKSYCIVILATTKVINQALKGGVKRQELSLRRITLTDYKIDIKRAKREEVCKAINDNNFKKGKKIL